MGSVVGSVAEGDRERLTPSPPTSPPPPTLGQRTLSSAAMDENASPPPSPQPTPCLLKPISRARPLRRRSSCTPSVHGGFKAAPTPTSSQPSPTSSPPSPEEDDVRVREGTPTPEGTPPPDSPPRLTVELDLSSSPPLAIEHRVERTWSVDTPRRLVIRLPKRADVMPLPKRADVTPPPPMPILLTRAIAAAIEAVERIAEDGADVPRKRQVLCAAVNVLGSAGAVGTRADAGRAYVGPAETALYAVACRILVGTLDAALCSYLVADGTLAARSASLDRRRRDWWAAQPRWHRDLLVEATAASSPQAADYRAARADLRLIARRTIRLWRRADTEHVAVELARKTDAPLPSRRAVGALVATLTTVMDELLERTWPAPT